MLTQLEKAILRTIVYFDLFDYPLTAFEVWKWLYRPELPPEAMAYDTVAAALEESPFLAKHIERTEGFYHVKGRSSLVMERKDRNLRVDEQMIKAVRVAKLLRWIPTVRCVLLASSITFGNVKGTSDIDMVIVVKHDEIWFTRFWAAGMLKLLRQRPFEGSNRYRICLTMYVVDHDDALNIQQASWGPDDIVYRYYVQSFIPIYDPDHVYERLLRANVWWQRDIPNAYAPQALTLEVGRPSWLRIVQRVVWYALWPFFHGPLGEWYCSLQMRIMPERLKSIANVDTRVIISDRLLKFHSDDNRRELAHKWKERLKQYE